MGSEIRSSDLEIGLSSNAGMAGTDIDTAASMPASLHLSIHPHPDHFTPSKRSVP